MCVCKDIAMTHSEHKEAVKEEEQQNLAKGFMEIKDVITKEILKALKAERKKGNAHSSRHKIENAI
jgi:hypothetical protein